MSFWAEALIRLLARPSRADDVIGDLNEMRGRRLEQHGRWVAEWLTLLGVIDMSIALVGQRFRSARKIRGPQGQEFYPIHMQVYRTRGWRMRRHIDDWSRDLMQAARSLRRARGFTLVTVTTLALAIGSNTAIFSVINTVLLDPLDYPNADRLVTIRASAPGTDMPEIFNPAPEFFVQYRDEADMLQDIGMYATGQTTVRSDDQIDRLFVTQVTSGLYATLGVSPILGRLPNESDEPGQVMMMSDRLWGDWFGSDPAVVGRSYEDSGQMRTVIGVMGPDFRFPEDRISLWIHNAIADETELRPGRFGVSLVARMRPGVGTEDLEGQLNVLAARITERFGGPERYADIVAKHRAVVITLEEDLVGDIAQPLWLLLGTVGIVLLIACANVANLFSVRGEGRRHDLGVRQALGAGRGGLVRGQMSEALLLAAAGGAIGVFLAWVGIPLLVRAAPENIPNLSRTSLDANALLFTAGVSGMTALAFGLLPAIGLSKLRFVGALRQSGQVGRRRRLGRDVLVLVQTASALVLLVGSGLMLRSFWTLRNIDPGYETENIFSFQVAPQRDELTDGPSYARFHEMFMERVAALPGVESVGLTNWLPLDEQAGSNRFSTESTLLSGVDPPPMRMTFVDGDYFETMGISLLRGRLFEQGDHETGPTNAIVGQAAADKLWPGEATLGQRMLVGADTTQWITVVGVVEDILLADFRQDVPDPMVYLPAVGPTPRSWAVGSPAYVVKSTRADVLAPEIRALMNEVVPESPMYRVFTMEQLAERSMAQLSFTMLMIVIAAGMALVLGGVGLYGVLSHVVSNRSREIAVRMALGAQAERVLRMVVAQGARMTALGVLLGLIAAIALTRVLDSLLFGVGTLDVPTFVGMSAAMLAVAFLASYIPAKRASSVDPMQSLRAE